MKNFEGPIIQENFNDAWEYGQNKIAEIKKKKIVQKIIFWVGNLSFLFMLLLETYGALYRFQAPAFQAYLTETKILAFCWGILGRMVNHPEMHIILQIIINLIPVFVVPVVLCLCAYAVCMNVYKPARKEITGDSEKDSLELYKIAREIEFRAFKPILAVSLGCNVVYMVGVLGYISSYLLRCLKDNNMEVLFAFLQPIVEKYDWLIYNKDLMTLAGIIIVGLYGALNTGLAYILRLMCIVKISDTFVSETEQYFYECNPEEKARFEEEERVLALAEEIKKRRRQEKIVFEEGLDAKVKDLMKKIKFVGRIAIVVIVIILSVWLGTMIKPDEIMKTLQSYTSNGIEQSTELPTEAVEE